MRARAAQTAKERGRSTGRRLQGFQIHLGATTVVSSRLPPYHAEPPSQDLNAPKLMIEHLSKRGTRAVGRLARVLWLVVLGGTISSAACPLSGGAARGAAVRRRAVGESLARDSYLAHSASWLPKRQPAAAKATSSPRWSSSSPRVSSPRAPQPSRRSRPSAVGTAHRCCRSKIMTHRLASSMRTRRTPTPTPRVRARGAVSVLPASPPPAAAVAWA